jgi:hypothetical protein
MQAYDIFREYAFRLYYISLSSSMFLDYQMSVPYSEHVQ